MTISPLGRAVHAPSDLLARWRESGSPIDIEPGRAFALARAAKEEERFDEARALLEVSLTGDPEVRSLSLAHIAHLHYYGGSFELGLAASDAAMDTWNQLGRAEAHLYASVNFIALNRAREALRHAQHARNLAQRVPSAADRHDLRFRIHRQLVHVHVARGEYVAAENEAAAARLHALRHGTARQLEIANYLRGYAAAARGRPEAGPLLQQVEISADTPFGRWVRYVAAMHARDSAQLSGARVLRATSGIDVPWEAPLFDVAEGGAPPPSVVANGTSDEAPYRRATRGVLALVRGDVQTARDDLLFASEHFRRYEMHHYARGAALGGLAADLLQGRGPRETILLDVIREMPRLAVRRWPWWHPSIARAVAAYARRLTGDDAYWSSVAVSTLAPSTDEKLRSIGLTERELEVLHARLQHPAARREELAELLGLGSASVRSHLNHIRQKLGCGSARGADALRSRVDAL